MKKEAFELHVSLEGTIETTSMNFQARSSYLPDEVSWGHRFEPIISFDQERNKYQASYGDSQGCDRYKYFGSLNQIQNQIRLVL